jgi:hypothetical protein
MKQFATSCILLLLLLTTGGCCSVVAKSGDARVVKCWQLIHSQGHEMHLVRLPPISLARAGTNILHVVDLPPELAGLYTYYLTMPCKYEEDASEKDPPWKNSRITLMFRRLNGVELCRQQLMLGDHPQKAYGFGEHKWDLGWKLECSKPLDRSFDIVMIVEQPSPRSSDRLLLTGYGIYVRKP